MLIKNSLPLLVERLHPSDLTCKYSYVYDGKNLIKLQSHSKEPPVPISVAIPNAHCNPLHRERRVFIRHKSENIFPTAISTGVVVWRHPVEIQSKTGESSRFEQNGNAIKRNEIKLCTYGIDIKTYVGPFSSDLPARTPSLQDIHLESEESSERYLFWMTFPQLSLSVPLPFL